MRLLLLMGVVGLGGCVRLGFDPPWHDDRGSSLDRGPPLDQDVGSGDEGPKDIAAADRDVAMGDKGPTDTAPSSDLPPSVCFAPPFTSWTCMLVGPVCTVMCGGFIIDCAPSVCTCTRGGQTESCSVSPPGPLSCSAGSFCRTDAPQLAETCCP